MHPDFEKYKAPPSEREQVNVRLPRELVAKVRVLASLEHDSIANLMTEAAARVVENREESPLIDSGAVRQRIDELSAELSALRSFEQPQD